MLKSGVDPKLIAASDVLERVDRRLLDPDAAAPLWPTGFALLDEALGGGLRAGTLNLLAGAQGEGKTTFALQMARRSASSGRPGCAASPSGTAGTPPVPGSSPCRGGRCRISRRRPWPAPGRCRPPAGRGRGREDPGIVADAIRAALSEAGIKGKNIVTAVGGRDVIIKKIQIERVKEQQARELMRWDAEQHVPFDMESVELDFQILNPDATGAQMEVLLVAVKRDKVNDYVSVISQTGKSPAIVDIDTNGHGGIEGPERLEGEGDAGDDPVLPRDQRRPCPAIGQHGRNGRDILERLVLV